MALSPLLPPYKMDPQILRLMTFKYLSDSLITLNSSLNSYSY